MAECFERCTGRFNLAPGPETHDGKPTYLVVCSGGKVGGCKGPSNEQIQAFSEKRGRELGARSQLKPLVIAGQLGPLTRTWHTPPVTVSLGILPDEVVFRKGR